MVVAEAVAVRRRAIPMVLAEVLARRIPPAVTVVEEVLVPLIPIVEVHWEAEMALPLLPMR